MLEGKRLFFKKSWNPEKIRRNYNDNILAGFAGSAADSFALFARFEAKLEQYRGNLERSAVELAKDWRTDRALRRLEAMLVVLDRKSTFLLSGTGDLIEPDDGIIGIGSGGAFAQAAAQALARHTALAPREIAQHAMSIASQDGSTYAVDVTGEGGAWGSNGSGQLGDGTTQSRAAPVSILAP